MSGDRRTSPRLKPERPASYIYIVQSGGASWRARVDRAMPSRVSRPRVTRGKMILDLGFWILDRSLGVTRAGAILAGAGEEGKRTVDDGRWTMDGGRGAACRVLPISNKQ